METPDIDIPRLMTGGEAIVRSLMANGIDTIFGLPGAQTYPFFDALSRLGVRTLTSRHEQGSAYMAYGAAKSTGRPSTFCVVPGPGVLNATAALCTADGACAQVLGVTGEIPTGFAGKHRGHLHELRDQRGTLAGVVGHAATIPSVADASTMVNEAFTAMRTGRRGPAVVEMAWDVMAAEADAAIIRPGAAQNLPELDTSNLDLAAELLAASVQPLIVVGGGAQHASWEVRQLAEKLGAPVTTNRSGHGVLPANHPLWLDPVAARLLWPRVDLVLGIGSRLEMPSMRWRNMLEYEDRLSGGRKLIRIDSDAAEMTRLIPDAAIVGDSAQATRVLIDAVAGRPESARTAEEFTALRADARQRYSRCQPQVDYLDVIREVLPRDGFLVPELCQVGFASWFAWPVYEPRTYVTEGYQGTLGFGFPTAIGVKVANPGHSVVSITGDGGFLFGVQELATAAENKVGLVTIVFDNGGFANVRRDQDLRYAGRRIGSELVQPDFCALAESFGVDACGVGSPLELGPALARALSRDEPTVIVVSDGRVEASPWEFLAMAEEPKRS